MEKANIAPSSRIWSPNHYQKLLEQQALICVTFFTSHGPPGFMGITSACLALEKPFANIDIDHQAPVPAAVLRQRKKNLIVAVITTGGI